MENPIAQIAMEIKKSHFLGFFYCIGKLENGLQECLSHSLPKKLFI